MKNLSVVAEKIGPFDADDVAHMAALTPFLQFKDTPDGVSLSAARADTEAKVVLTEILEESAGTCFKLRQPNQEATLCHDAQSGGWTLRPSFTTSQSVQNAYLVLAGVAPTAAISAQLPWCSVPGFVETHAQLVSEQPSKQAYAVPSLLVPRILFHVLRHCGTVDIITTK